MLFLIQILLTLTLYLIKFDIKYYQNNPINYYLIIDSLIQYSSFSNSNLYFEYS
jgi:hypothetical protein